MTDTVRWFLGLLPHLDDGGDGLDFNDFRDPEILKAVRFIVDRGLATERDERWWRNDAGQRFLEDQLDG